MRLVRETVTGNPNVVMSHSMKVYKRFLRELVDQHVERYSCGHLQVDDVPPLKKIAPSGTDSCRICGRSLCFRQLADVGDRGNWAWSAICHHITFFF